MSLPCGMTFTERLLLPNLGEEGATFLTHVAAVYEDMPDALMLLHGGPLHVWHAQCRCAPLPTCAATRPPLALPRQSSNPDPCSVAIRRMRAFYRGVGPAATPAMRAFVAHPVTLNSLLYPMERAAWMMQDCCGPLLSKVGRNASAECPWEWMGALCCACCARYCLAHVV